MFSPFEKDKKYFIKTVTFYYIGTYVARKGKFYKFKDIQIVLGIDDWDNFWKCRPNLPLGMKPISAPETWLSGEGIIEVTPWAS